MTPRLSPVSPGGVPTGQAGAGRLGLMAGSGLKAPCHIPTVGEADFHHSIHWRYLYFSIWHVDTFGMRD